MELYRVFYHVASEKSFSRAAEKLFVTQPAVSQAISQLEGKLEQRLIIRHSKGISLTEAGEILFTHIEPAFHIIRSGEVQLDALKDLRKGSITISASDTICMYYLPEILGIFKGKYPEINIRIANKTTSETIEALRRGKADIGIINIPEKMDGRIRIWKKTELSECFAAGEAYHALAGKKLSPEEVADLPLMLLEKGTSTRMFIDKFFNELGIRIQPEIELGSVDLLLKFAAIGMGVSCVTREYLQKSEFREKLFILESEMEFPKRYLGVITIRNVPLTKAARAFLDIILEEER
ncbi:MAG: LysR family transcriptional regulator [Clostridia bacterium]